MKNPFYLNWILRAAQDNTLYNCFKRLPNLLVLLAVILCMPAYASAGLIRDAEIEAYLKDLATPVYRAAGLSADQVRMFIVQDNSLNAFVAGGTNMFIHTGLITETTTPDMLLGVIAHETGHIAGGHLLRGGALASRSQVGSILTYLLGAAAIAGGGGNAGAAIIAAGSHVANRQFLAYTRSNEQAADQAALSYLDTLNISPEGMVMMFERLRREEKAHIGDNVDVYARTHPLSQQRLAHIRSYMENSAAKPSLGKAIAEKHARIRAKLVGFLDDNGQTSVLYPASDQSIAAHVARAIATSARSNRKDALSEIDAALASLPNDAYLHELRGHILFENGDIAASVNAYRHAVKLAPDAALIRSDFAKTLLALNHPKADLRALTELQQSAATDPTYHQTWRLLAEVYGRQDNLAMAELSLAELAALDSDEEALELHLDRAEHYDNGSQADPIRMNDLRAFAALLKTRKKEESLF